MQKKWIEGTGLPAALVILVLIGSSLSYQWGESTSLSMLQQLKQQTQEIEQKLAQTRKQLQQLQQTLETLNQQLNQTREAIQLMEQELTVPESFFNSPRTRTGSVSGGWPYLGFTGELKISPYYNLTEGEIQAFSVWVRSELPVVKVVGTIETDDGNITIQFRLTEGTTTLGKWVGFWIIRDGTLYTDSAGHTYENAIVFQAIDEAGRDIRMPISVSY